MNEKLCQFAYSMKMCIKHSAWDKLPEIYQQLEQGAKWGG